MCYLQFNVSNFSDCVLGFRRPSLNGAPQRQSTEALLKGCTPFCARVLHDTKVQESHHQTAKVLWQTLI